MSQSIEDRRPQKQAHDLLPTEKPVSDFIASGERPPDLVKSIIESFCDHLAPGGAILAVFDFIIFIPAIESRRSMQRFTSEIVWGVGSLDRR